MTIDSPTTSVKDQLTATPTPVSRWRLPLLCALLLASIGVSIAMAQNAAPSDKPVIPADFLRLYFLNFLPYLAACFVILRMRPPSGRQRQVELGLILLGGLVLRALLLPLPPNLSHDSWRYLWDARVTLHGYSPYVYAPDDSLFANLRDFIYNNSRFRNVPTIYPPGAQASYLLSYLLAPSNLYVLKGIFMLFDLATCVTLMLLLKQWGLDPARAVLYAWCPLPIVEFALQGHVDALPIAFTMLTLLAASSDRRGARALTGFFLAMATLTKLYPLLFLVAVIRRRDWTLLLTCFATIALAYLPYLILGHGQVLGFFSTYASEHQPNAGPVQLIISWLNTNLGFHAKRTTLTEYAVDGLLVGATLLTLLILRLRSRISMEAATLILLGVIFVVSSHIYPWYTAAILPLVALLLTSLWRRTPYQTTQGGMMLGRRLPAPSSKGLAVAFAWYFACITPLSYFYGLTTDWSLYYLLVYDIPLLGLALAALIELVQWGRKRQFKPSPLL